MNQPVLLSSGVSIIHASVRDPACKRRSSLLIGTDYVEDLTKDAPWLPSLP